MSLFSEVLDHLVPMPIFYVRLMRNEFEVSLVDQDKSLRRNSVIPFSNDRLLIAEFEPAEHFLRELMDELLNQKGKIVKTSVQMVLQPVDKLIQTIARLKDEFILMLQNRLEQNMFGL